MSKPLNFDIADDSGANVRTDLNNVFESIIRNHGYGSEPSARVAYMWYANTVSGRMGFYKTANSGDTYEFISLVNGNFYGPNGSAGTPSYTFTNSGSSGFYRSASNQIGVSTNGSLVFEFKANQVDCAGDLFIQRSGADSQLTISTGVNDQDSIIDLVADTTNTDFGLRIRRQKTSTGASDLIHVGTGAFNIFTQDAASMVFATSNAGRFSIEPTGNLRCFGSDSHLASTHAGSIAAKGIAMRNGVQTDNGTNPATVSSHTGNLFNFWWDGNDAYMFVDNTRLGHIDASTTSDYRIKRNVATLAVDAIERVKKLRPITFQYKDYDIYKQSEAVHEGFIAHELGEVIPDACKGTKDEGLQFIGIAPLVATLTKALQESVAKIETLETKVAALEGS